MTVADRLERWTNPLLLKELRQGLRNRGMLASAQASLLFCVGAFVLAAVDDSEYTQPGRPLAVAVGFCLCGVTLVILPNTMRTQLAQDFSSRTFELVRMAGMSPWGLATGLYLGGAARIAFVTALMAPFLVATVLGGGLVFEQIATALVLVLSAASLAVAGIVALGALAEGSVLGKLLGRGLQALPFFWFFFVGTVATGLLNPYGPTEVEYAAASAVVIGAVGTLFLLRLGADALTPEGIRTFLWTKGALFVASAGWTGVMVAAAEGRGDEQFVTLALGGALPWLVGVVSTRTGPGSARWPWLLRDGFGPSLLYAMTMFVGTGAAFAVFAGSGAPLVYATRLGIFFAETCAITRVIHAFVDRRRTDAAWFLMLWTVIAAAEMVASTSVAVLDAASVQTPWVLGAMLPSATGFASYRFRFGWEIYPLAVTAACLLFAHLREGSGAR